MPIEHMSQRWHDDQNYGVDQMGVSITYGSPTPLKNPSTFPGNTHGIIRLKFMQSKLTTDCYTKETQPVLKCNDWFYSQDECIKEAFINGTLEKCQCKLVIGDIFPRNGEVCTPTKMNNCVLKRVIASGIEDETNITAVSTVGSFWNAKMIKCTFA